MKPIGGLVDKVFDDVAPAKRASLGLVLRRLTAGDPDGAWKAWLEMGGPADPSVTLFSRERHDWAQCRHCRGTGQREDGKRCDAFGCHMGRVSAADDARTECPVCKGTQWVGVRDKDNIWSTRAEPCGCVGADQRILNKLANAGVPLKYRSLTLGGHPALQGPQAEYLRAAIAQFLAGDGEYPGLFLEGAFGLGKSGLAAGLARELCLQKDVQWIDWPEFVLMISDLWRSGEEAILTVVTSLSRAEVLFIDDLGQEEVESTTDAQRRMLKMILERRFGKPTVITTMRSIGQLTQRYEGYCTDRIYETCAMVLMQGESLRRKF